MTSFETRNLHRYYDPATHKVVPKDAVVLDLESAYGCHGEQRDPAKIVAALRETNSVAAHDIARQIEAQTKPPRMVEPGWGGVVEAGVKQHDERLRWQRTGDFSRRWKCEQTDEGLNGGEYDRTWSDLIDPVLIRPGIEDES